MYLHSSSTPFDFSKVVYRYELRAVQTQPMQSLVQIPKATATVHLKGLTDESSVFASDCQHASGMSYTETLKPRWQQVRTTHASTLPTNVAYLCPYIFQLRSFPDPIFCISHPRLYYSSVQTFADDAITICGAPLHLVLKGHEHISKCL